MEGDTDAAAASVTRMSLSAAPIVSGLVGASRFTAVAPPPPKKDAMVGCLAAGMPAPPWVSPWVSLSQSLGIIGLALVCSLNQGDPPSRREPRSMHDQATRPVAVASKAR